MVMLSAQWWFHGLVWGGVAALGIGAALIGMLFAAPYAFMHDYPADIRKRAAPPTPRQRRAGNAASLGFLVALLLGLGGVVFSWAAMQPQKGFWDLVLMALLALLLFVVVDIVIVDWLVWSLWRPRRIVLPGTEECAGWRDYGFHVRAQFRPRGLIVLALGSLLLGGLAWLIF